MAKVKLNSMPDYTAKMPNSPHDVSQSTGFTCPPGQISPVYFDMLHLGDEIHFSAAMFARYNPLITAALGDVDVHLDYFFVPLTVMYTPTSSMFYLTDDLISSVIDKAALDPEKFPVFGAAHKFYRDSEGTNTWFDAFYGARASATYSTGEEYRYFDCVGKNIFRMWDFLDLAPWYLYDHGNVNIDNYPLFTPWFALAYQAIYQLHPGFRNTDREEKCYNYNIDKFYSEHYIYDSDYTVGDNWWRSIFALHYANRPKDYFQSVKVSPMGSAVSLLKDPGEVFRSVNDWLNNADYYPVSSSPVSSRQNFSNSVQTGGTQAVSSNSIRQLFMIDKLLRVIGRSEKNYESQFLAHYGIKIPHDVMHNITHIGHDVATLSASPVISSADTFNGESGSALGEVGGQGSVMLRGQKYNFKAPFHGVFMTLAYFVPRQRYVSGINKLHQLSSIQDFWQPEFDQKGMQPIFLYELFPKPVNDITVRYGWQFAYEQFKRRYDRVTMAFAPTADHQSGQVNSYAPWFVSSLPYKSIGATGTVSTETVPTLNFTSFKVHPTDLNGIMQVPYNPSWSADYLTSPWLVYQTDPFICDFNIHIKKVNGMSEYGEPEL